MRKKYLAFTLTELLMVMGVLIVLSGVAIFVGRYAIQRSREAHYKSNVRLIYSLLVQYKEDFGKYPDYGQYSDTTIGGEVIAHGFRYRDRNRAIFEPYFDGYFDGGVEATYYYYTQEQDAQFVIVCVSLGGVYDLARKGFYCDGDGIGILPVNNPIPRSDISPDETEYVDEIKKMDRSNWREAWGGFSDNPPSD
jgi:type II secretory pathway pseudopilin PulG